MERLNILLATGGDGVKSALLDSFRDEDIEVAIDAVQNVEDALEAMVTSGHDVCVIRSMAADLDTALSIASDAKEAGLRIPIVVLMDLTQNEHERALISSGAIAAIPWDGSQNAMLRNIVRLAMTMRKTEEKLRESNDRLVNDLVTNQDMRERAEEMNAQYVELAEDYAQAKERLEDLNQEKNKFFSIIAHDLKSPFTSLLGFTGILDNLSDNLPPEKVKEYASSIHKSATHVFKLLENLLEWARLQMDRVEQAPELIDLTEIAGRTLEVLGPVAADKGLEILEETNGAQAFADPHMVDATIRNLVNNAIKFTPGGGKITIAAKSNDKSVMVTITDTGVGMKPEVIDKLFLVSESVTTPGTGGEKGTGLGLILCKEMVERNGGEIWVESEVGKGSTFCFTLPVSES